MDKNDDNNDAPEDPTPVAFTRPTDQFSHSGDGLEATDANIQSFVRRRVQENYRPEKDEGETTS